ncbi:MAG: (d)CMP kinase [Puniceicoccales bacterium]|jgi:cytidylate kinase|nr:(d)CMP kinase [Puniceicoccales bacterium]
MLANGESLARKNFLAMKSLSKSMAVLIHVPMNFITIAIDGAAATGKTSTALRIAEKYGFLAVSTGLHYRAITLEMLRAGVKISDTSSINAFLLTITTGTKIVKNSSYISLNGTVFSESELRIREINAVVSQYSAVGGIRKFLFEYQRSQRDVARKNNFKGLVEEGRDIASVIFPDADLKFFLEASADNRSLRREKDSEEDDVLARDKIDGERTIRGKDVMCIDTGLNNLGAVVAIISAKIDELARQPAVMDQDPNIL